MPEPALPNEFLPDPPEFRRRLLRWHRRHGRDLPWRETRDPYAIMVSEFMLQQTQVATVIPYYHRWLERFPDFVSLARARESAVLHAWQGLGYYGRARNLHAAAKFVRQNFGGQLPADLAEIARLPGVGRYTAGAIASFGFDLPAPIVDTNVARVLARLTNWQRPIDSAAGRTHLWQTASALIPRRGARTYNSALIDLGATICLPRVPRCGACPVRDFCRAENPAALPLKRKKPAIIHLRESHALTKRGGRILLEQSRGRWRGMWMLPRLTNVAHGKPLLELDFPFTHHRVTLTVFNRPSPISPNEHEKWFSRRAIARLPVPAPHRRALAQLLSAPNHNNHILGR